MPSRPTKATLLAALACGAVACAPADAVAAQCANGSTAAGETSKKAMVRSTLCLLNAERSERGLRKLKLSKNLTRAARRHARDMARKNYFSHTSLNGSSFVDRIRRTGYLRNANRWFVGENLAWGTGSLSTPRATVRAWMRSPGHRRNILTRTFEHIGIGIAYDAPKRVSGRHGATYATSFGSKS
jgi:uncharacterized protein YkwD